VTRRSFLGAGIFGGLTGGVWTSTFLWAASVRNPVIEVIGRAKSQIVLIDSGKHRLLVLSGPFDQRLASDLDTLMGTLRRRIDLLISTESAFAAGATLFQVQFEIGRSVSLPESGSGASPHAEFALSTPAVLTFSDDVEVRLYPHFRFTSSVIDVDPGWRIEVQRGTQIAVIAANLDDLTAVPCGPFTLAIAPDGSIPHAERKSLAAVYAVNDTNIDAGVTASGLTRIFDSDAARFGLQKDSIRLPSWSTWDARQS
jgi:hypothetical protein